MVEPSSKLLASEENAITSKSKSEPTKRLFRLFFFFFWPSHPLCHFQRRFPYAARPKMLTPSRVIGPFRIEVLLPDVLREKRQIVARLLSEGDSALLPSHFGGVQ